MSERSQSVRFGSDHDSGGRERAMKLLHFPTRFPTRLGSVPSSPPPANAVPTPSEPGEFDIQYRVIHGHKRAFIHAGSGPALLLLARHRRLLRYLARHHPVARAEHTVIAPDLLGHGRSDKPRGDYSVAAYANGMRDLSRVLGLAARDRRRALARRRRRDAVRVSVSRALRALGPRRQRWRVPGGASPAAPGVGAERRSRPCRCCGLPGMRARSAGCSRA